MSHVVLLVALLLALSTSHRAEAQAIAPETLETLPAFIDATVPSLMEQNHVVGTALAIVYNGRTILLRGFGRSILDPPTNVDPARTVFRVGSITKRFTAAAVLQLVDDGRLDFQRDVQSYLPELSLRYGATAHQLLTHTAGLDEKFAGGYTDAPEQLQPLADHLRRYVVQVIPPGRLYSYSNTNYAIAGLLVERLGGMTYEQYMAERIFKPLKMTATTADQSAQPRMGMKLARGYRWTEGMQTPLPFRLTQSRPAGAITTTAADMGRFMLALLGDGALDGARILSPESRAAMFAEQYTPDPRIPAMAYGARHWFTHGEQLLHADGTLGDQVAVMLLAPDDKLGVFIASNSPSTVGNQLLDSLLTHLYGASTLTPPPELRPDGRGDSRQFVGTYRDFHHTRNDMSRLRALFLQAPVTVDEDGALRWRGHRWVEVEPRVFQSVDKPDLSSDKPDYIVFREDASGNIGQLHAWGATYERIGWLEQRTFHLGVLGICVITFAAYAICGLRRGWSREGRLARLCGVFVTLTHLVFVVGLVALFRNLGETVPLPVPVIVWLLLPIAGLIVTLVLPAFVVRAWRAQWWSRGDRILYTVATVFSVIFLTFLNYWKLLGFRY